MLHNAFFTSMFCIFLGAALLGTFALFTRQSLLLAYILSGFLLGPGVLGLVHNTEFITQISHFGIVFLLFLLGLDLQPQNLIQRIRQATSITLISSFLFMLIGYAISYAFGFKWQECLIVGICTMYSSTIIGLKLLPSTILHHQNIGETLVSILLLQDILAIFTLLFIEMLGVNRDFLSADFDYQQLLITAFGLPILLGLPFIVEKNIINPLFQRFQSIHEYVFLLALAWCLSIGFLAHILGFSYEIGAFMAGVSIAVSPISVFIATRLKPLRDFFLILFFFALGAGLKLDGTSQIGMVAVVLAMSIIIMKPIVFRGLLAKSLGNKLAWQLGFRIGQLSEFSILVAYLAFDKNIISIEISNLIQLTTIMTFAASSMIIGANYPIPGYETKHNKIDGEDEAKH